MWVGKVERRKKKKNRKISRCFGEQCNSIREIDERVDFVNCTHFLQLQNSEVDLNPFEFFSIFTSIVMIE